MKATSKRIALLLFSLLMAFSAGCASGGEKSPTDSSSGAKPAGTQESAVLTLCVDKAYAGSERYWGEGLIEPLIEYYETSHDHKVRMETLVISDGEERSNQIQKLQTEMMSGGGPDLFFFSSQQYGARYEGEIRQWLFKDFNKAMHIGSFADLSSLMEADESWDPAQFYEPVMQAGAIDGKQYILPVSISYPAVFAVDSERIQAADADSFLRLLTEKQVVFNRQIPSVFSSVQPLSLFSQPIDYAQEALRLTEEELAESVRLCDAYNQVSKGTAYNPEISDEENTARQETAQTVLSAENPLIAAYLGQPCFSIAQQAKEDDTGFSVYPVASFDGEYPALVTDMAAVSAGSAHPQEAYDFIKLLLSKEIQSGSGFAVDKGDYSKFYGNLACSYLAGVPVRKDVTASQLYPNSQAFRPDIDLEDSDFSFPTDTITAARFYTEYDARADLMNLGRTDAYKELSEDERQTAAADLYRDLKLAASE